MQNNIAQQAYTKLGAFHTDSPITRYSYKMKYKNTYIGTTKTVKEATTIISYIKYLDRYEWKVKLDEKVDLSTGEPIILPLTVQNLIDNSFYTLDHTKKGLLNNKQHLTYHTPTSPYPTQYDRLLVHVYKSNRRQGKRHPILHYIPSTLKEDLSYS